MKKKKKKVGTMTSSLGQLDDEHLEAKAKCQQGIDTAHNAIKAIDVKRIVGGLAPSYSFVHKGASLAQPALLEPVNVLATTSQNHISHVLSEKK